MNEAQKKYYEKNKKDILERKNIYRRNNKEKISEQNKKYKEANKEKIKEADKKYREEHKEQLSIQNKKYREEHKQDISEKKKKTYRENTRRINSDKSKRDKKRYEEDITFRIKTVLRSRLRMAVVNKYSHTMDLVGCSIEELMKHLESQFQDGMSWDNYGEWHIDHIRPCASFDLLNEEEQRACFHYSNLQPLWAVDNLRKGSKL